MSTWYEYHLLFLVAWIICNLTLASFELYGWKNPEAEGKVASISSRLSIVWGYPTWIGMVISLGYLHDSSNFQFPTYIIFMISCAIVLYAGLLGAFMIHRRKEHYAKGESGKVEDYIKRLRLSFIISIPAALLAAAAELHIMTNWITDLLN